MQQSRTSDLPVLALAIGDPAGIGPELAAKLVPNPAIREAARLVVIGDARVLALGAEQAGISLDVDTRTSGQDLEPASRPVLLDLAHLGSAHHRTRTGPAGRAARSRCATFAPRSSSRPRAASTPWTFTPFNKAAMRMEHPPYDDEIGYTAEVLDLRDVPGQGVSTCSTGSGTPASRRTSRSRRSPR